MIIVTNWEEAEKDDFYLSADWLDDDNKEDVKRAKKLQRNKDLFIAYIANAKDYCIYGKIDAEQVFIDIEWNIILSGESQVIGTDFEDKISYDY